MITCPRCEAQYPTIGALAGHLAFTHTITDGRAMSEAHRAAGSCPGCGRTTGTHTKACAYRDTWTPTVVTAARASDARVAQPTARRTTRAEVAGSTPAPRSTPPAPEETPMAKKDGCTHCAKRAKDDPCPYHGGARPKPTAAHKKAAAGRSKPKPATAARMKRRTPDKPAGIAARIQGLVQLAAAGKQAAVALVEIRKLVRA